LNARVPTGRPEVPAAVVISLDFEMRWGVHDKLGMDINAYRDNLKNVRLIVPALLELFKEHQIRATWATVGALGCGSWTEYFSNAPPPPKYQRQQLAISEQYVEMDPKGRLHFAPELLEAILATPGQELGSHTFSHIYLRESGVTVADAQADFSAVMDYWGRRLGVRPISLVFPRNQSNFIETYRSAGVRIWRGNERPWYYDCTDSRANTMFPRALRAIDSLNPLVRRASRVEDDMTRSSLFLRLGMPVQLWSLHMARIRKELEYLTPGEVFHVWWHPHNLGNDMSNKLRRVRQFLDIVSAFRDRGVVVSMNMQDLVLAT
jgi:hypothetical protein